MSKKNLQSKQNLLSKTKGKIFPAVFFLLLTGPNSGTALVWARSPQAPASHSEIALTQDNAPQSPDSSAQLNASSQSYATAEQGKAKLKEIKQLLAEYFPRAKIEHLRDTLKVTYKAKNGISVYTQREELMPDPDGLLCSVAIKSGPYSGKDSLNLAANQFYYNKLTLAPYLETENNHLLAQLSYGARVPVEFIQQFKTIVNAYAPATTEAARKIPEDTGSQLIAPAGTTGNQQTPSTTPAGNTTTANKTEAKRDKLFLWKAVRGKDTVYLLGTIHVAKRDFYPLPRGILDAFQGSNHLLVEADITDAAFVKLLESTREKTSGLYKPPERLRDKLKPETKKVFESYLQWAGESWDMYDKYKPWLVTEIISGSIPRRGELTQFKGRYGIDLFLLNQAKKNDVKVSSLEPPERELIFAQMPEAAADARLLAMLLELKDLDKEMNNIFKIWRSGDYQAMDEIDKASERRVPDLRQFHKVLLDDRNIAMVNKLLQLMPKYKGPHFVAVGSAHMGGETGMVEQLKKQGFTVEQMENRIAPTSLGLELSKVKDNFPYAPGPCLERRQNLYKLIQASKEKGIGITGYMNSFLEIEKGITQQKMSETAILAEINRIETALGIQVSPLRQHIITPYCIQIEKLLSQKLAPKVKLLTKDCILSCTIDEDGKIIEVKASEEDKSAPAIKAQAVQILQGVGTLPKPPQSPLKLKILLSHNLNNIEAWYRGVVDHDQFMTNVRKKVLAKWHVTNIRSATETTITFVVKRDGTIENIRFLKSSGSPEAEEAAIMAVQGAAPFQNLPDGSRKREQITFSFETQE